MKITSVDRNWQGMSRHRVDCEFSHQSLPTGFHTPVDFRIYLEFANGAAISVNSFYDTDED